MTPDEMDDYLVAMNERDKDDIAKNYNLAVMIANFVNCAMGGHEIPNMFEVFPNMYSEEEINAFYQKQALDEFSKLATMINAERANNK